MKYGSVATYLRYSDICLIRTFRVEKLFSSNLDCLKHSIDGNSSVVMKMIIKFALE